MEFHIEELYDQTSRETLTKTIHALKINVALSIRYVKKDHGRSYVVHLRGAYEVLNYRITVDFFRNYRDTVIKFLYKYRHRSIFYQKLYIFPSPWGDWNTEYRPFFIQITVSPLKKSAITEYRHILRPPNLHSTIDQLLQ